MFTLMSYVPRHSVQKWFSTDVRSRTSGKTIRVRRGSVGWPCGWHTASVFKECWVHYHPRSQATSLKGFHCYKDRAPSNGGNIRRKSLCASNIPQPTDNAQQNRFLRNSSVSNVPICWNTGRRSVGPHSLQLMCRALFTREQIAGLRSCQLLPTYCWG